MKPKEYKIKTLRDMVNATNHKNIDHFLLDLKAIILNTHFVESISKEVEVEDSFTWIDDDINKLIVNMEAK